MVAYISQQGMSNPNHFQTVTPTRDQTLKTYEPMVGHTHSDHHRVLAWTAHVLKLGKKGMEEQCSCDSHYSTGQSSDLADIPFSSELSEKV